MASAPVGILRLRSVTLLTWTLAGACAPAVRPTAFITKPEESLVSSPGDTSSPRTIAEGWWHALTLGDTAFLARRTADRLALTLSNGQAFGRASLLAEAATHVPKPSTFVNRMTDVSVLSLEGASIVSGRMEEGSQGGSNTFHYLTVLERAGQDWQVIAAQSTRELSLTARVPAQVAGPLTDYAGSYRGQRGGILRIVAQDSVLALLSPDGSTARLEPIGPGMFELSTLYDGIAVVRFAFSRDADGRVATLSRLIHGSVMTWARIP